MPSLLEGAERLESLSVFKKGYPRVFFFRQAEGFAANQRVGYPVWERNFERLMGIIGKVLDEEVPGRSKRNIDFFTRFKKRHPDQLVLLHYNGNARDPRYEREVFFAGHWVYYNGARIRSAVPAEDGITEIKVDDVSLFRTSMGRYRTKNEDIGLCALDAEGKPDWHQSEQVQLLSIDPAKKILKVKRGCYGSKVRSFAAGRSYAAAHVTEGPWGRKSHLMWMYNYAETCPRDADGRRCRDVLAGDVARRFLSGGELEAFDGLEFDVLLHQRFHTHGGRGADCNGDGLIDNGFENGVNVYGIGVTRFCRDLRGKLGADRLILADGHGSHHQRAFHILNGIESEGWPALNDWQVEDWSGGLNRHFFWAADGCAPAFSYVNHKYVQHGDEPGVNRRPDVPFSIHRLVFAAAVFTDSAICYSYAPRAGAGDRIGIWDEFRKGAEGTLGWLGRPLGPAVHLAAHNDCIVDAGNRRSFFRKHFAAEKPVQCNDKPDGFEIRSEDNEVDLLTFHLRDIPCRSKDLFVSLTARGAPLKAYPKETARYMTFGIAPPRSVLTKPDLPERGVCLRGGTETQLTEKSRSYFRWIQRCGFNGETHSCYFVHPPYREGPGYTFWRRTVTVPEKGGLDFYLAMGKKSPERSDGVVFRVLLRRTDAETHTKPLEIFRHLQKASKWTHHLVPLEKWAGRTVELTFSSDCGPKNNSTTDHSHWGDVRVTGGDGEEAWIKPIRHMSWLGEEDFTSHFYFRVNSKKVDLSFQVEGAASVQIPSLVISSHADAMYRVFENGIVLANPSPEPYTFDLNKLCPGKKFRRLQGTALQDPSVNNGRPVGRTVALGPKDGLFLAGGEGGE